MNLDSLWREFPKDLQSFEAAFPDDEACRRYLIRVRWGDVPRCRKCSCEETWELGSGRFECRECGYQMSVTAGTPMHRTKKPLLLWFRAIWEVTTHRTGISAKDLQRVLGFGSYETAWTWLHKLRACMARPTRLTLQGRVQFDDTCFGGNDHHQGRPKPGGKKSLVFVAVEPRGRVRLEHSPNIRSDTVKNFFDRNIDERSAVLTDGYRSFNDKALGARNHHRHVQGKKRNIVNDPLQVTHFVIGLAKRMWVGTYHGGISKKHMQYYLDEFEFRHNRRRTRGVGRVMARLLHEFVNHSQITYQDVISRTVFGRFETA